MHLLQVCNQSTLFFRNSLNRKKTCVLKKSNEARNNYLEKKKLNTTKFNKYYFSTFDDMFLSTQTLRKLLNWQPRKKKKSIKSQKNVQTLVSPHISATEHRTKEKPQKKKENASTTLVKPWESERECCSKAFPFLIRALS